MAAKMRATIETRGSEARNVDVEAITPVGILIDAGGGGDEVTEVLIPWHRVWEVYSHHEGALLFETRGN